MASGARDITDDMVRGAVGGSQAHVKQIMEILNVDVSEAVAARLCPTPDLSDAVDDVSQDVLLAVLKGLPNLETQTAKGLRSYASKIRRNKVSDLIKQKTRRRKASLDATVKARSGTGPLWQHLPGRTTTPRSAAERAELAQKAVSALQRLTTEQHEAIVLSHWDRLETREVAEIMCIPPKKVLRLIEGALEALRREMGH